MGNHRLFLKYFDLKLLQWYIIICILFVNKEYISY